MMEIKEGDVILFRRNDSIFSRVISLFTLSSYVHSGIVSFTGEKGVVIAEAVTSKFKEVYYRNTHLEKKKQKGKIKVIRPNEKIDIDKLTLFVLSNLGKDYGFLKLLNIATKKFFGMNITKSSKKTLICSEATARAIHVATNKKINIANEFKIKFDYIEPSHLERSKNFTHT